MSDIEVSLAKQSVRAGLPIPARILNAPKVRKGLQFYLDAFNELDTERNHNNGIERIPRSKIVEYANDIGLDSDFKADLIEIVLRLDYAHTERLKAKLKRENGNPKKFGRKANDDSNETK